MTTTVHLLCSRVKHPVYQRDVYIAHNAPMHDTYARLLSAAKTLRGWKNPTEITVGLTALGYETSSQKMTNWKTRGLSKDALLKCPSLLTCRPEWLSTGDGPMTYDALAESNAEYAPRLAPPRRIPVVGTAQLGDNGYWAELEYPAGHGDGYILLPTRDANAYALRCKGDSMRPRIRDGEFVVIEPGSPPFPGDEVLVKATDGRVMVKTLLYIRDGRVHLLSINEAHPTIAIDERDIEVIHPVTAIVKRSMWIP